VTRFDFIDWKLVWFPCSTHVPWESRGCAKWCSYTRKAYRTWSLIVPKRTFWSLRVLNFHRCLSSIKSID